jgi:hypothetical protein
LEFSIWARVCSSCSRADARLASRFCTRFTRFFASISSSSCPRWTVSPSATFRLTTLPIVSALMFTDRFGWTLPLADTMDSRSRRSTFSVVTDTPVVRCIPRLAHASPASTTTTPRAMRIFLLRDMDLQLA